MNTMLLLSLITLAFQQAPRSGNPASSNAGPAGIDFHSGTWASALEAARAQQKPVFLDMYAAWCGPCKRLKETTFTDPRVGEYFNANYINVALDAEKGEGFELARQYGIRGYPTLLFLDPSGTVIERAVGYHDAETLIALGKRIHPSSN